MRSPAVPLPAAPIQAERVPLYGCPLDNLTFEQAVERLVELARGNRPTFVVTPNVDHLVRLRGDRAFAAAYREASLRLADGMPLLWAARLRGTPIRSKVSGSDLVPALCRRAADEGLRVFFLGGCPGAIERAAETLGRRHPGLCLAGALGPPPGFERDEAANDAVLEQIRRGSPHILFVGLGSPRQELWMLRNHVRAGVPLSIGVGAAVDFVVGLRSRAPLWMQRGGMEWVYRLGQEPGRLWRRYLVRDLPFVVYLARLLLRRAIGRRPSLEEVGEPARG